LTRVAGRLATGPVNDALNGYGADAVRCAPLFGLAARTIHDDIARRRSRAGICDHVSLPAYLLDPRRPRATGSAATAGPRPACSFSTGIAHKMGTTRKRPEHETIFTTRRNGTETEPAY